MVDEINQGMDPRNERLVHKRMVGIATGSDEGSALSHAESNGDGNGNGAGAEANGIRSGGSSSQYFLITPKLLHGLDYASGMQVLCISSGEYMAEERSKVAFRDCVNMARGLQVDGIRVG